jgi:hypothetical protein
MNSKTTMMFGVGVLTAGLVLTGSARAHTDDQALAFITGAAVGYVVGGRDVDVRHVHYRPHTRHYRFKHGDHRWYKHGSRHKPRFAPKHKHHPKFHHKSRGKSYKHDKRHHRGHERRGWRS